MRRGAAIAAGLAAVLVTAPHAQQPVFRSGVDVVLVDVSVMRGRVPVAGLTARDFVLRDNNGVVQQIDEVSIGTVPLDVSLLVDLSGSSAVEIDAFAASIDRMRGFLRPGDRVRVIGVGDGVWPLSPMQPADAPLPVRIRAARGMTTLFDAIFSALAWPVPPDQAAPGGRVLGRLRHVERPGRRSAPADRGSRRRRPARDRVRRALVRRARGASAEVRTASGTVIRRRESTARLQAQNDRWRARQSALFDAAHRTGGAVHRLGERVAAFEEILTTFRSRYVLRYTPRGVEREGWHTLDISLARRGAYTVQARRGYQGG